MYINLVLYTELLHIDGDVTSAHSTSKLLNVRNKMYPSENNSAAVIERETPSIGIKYRFVVTAD